MHLNRFSRKGLEKSTQAWFITTALGQLAFIYYIVAYFGFGGIETNFQTWDKVADGIIAGDNIGNLSVATHLFLSLLVTLLGLLQLTPGIRKVAPHVHRTLGKIYIFIALLISLSGLFMVWIRGADAAGVMGQISASTNGILIIISALMTLRLALQKKFLAHQVWATRLFLVVSGVWFFRVGLQGWLFIQKEPLWIDMASFTGPFITFWNFGCYLVPLIIFEWYRYAKRKGATLTNLLMLTAISICSFCTLVGSFAALWGLWIPRIGAIP